MTEELQKLYSDAQKLYENLLTHYEVYDEALYTSLILIYRRLNLPHKQLQLYLHALTQSHVSYNLLIAGGNAFMQYRDYQKAIAFYKKALILNPNLTQALNNIGVAYKELGLYQEALAVYQRGLELNAEDSALHSNIGILYKNLKDFDKALSHLNEALKRSPQSADVYGNIGATLKSAFRHEEAIPYYHKALELNPKHVNANFDLSLLQLKNGDYAEGWKRYEFRLGMSEMRDKIAPYTKPMWLGEDIHDQTLIIQFEQGFGDNIQFARYIPLAAQKAKHTIVRTRRELVALFSKTFASECITVISQDDPLPEHDYFICLLSLPHLFGTTLTSIPNHFPYLQYNSKSKPYTIEKKKRSLAIGIVYSTSKTSKDHENKVFDLEHFNFLFDYKYVTVYSLQVGDDNNQIEQSRFKKKIIDLAPYLVDFHATASIMGQLDLLISADTATAHLCGALNLPGWIVVPKPADWRWMQEDNTTPWYKSLRLFRQEERTNWSSAFKKIEKAFQRFYETKIG